MDRAYPTRPFVGVGAVIWRDNEILLVRRGNPPRQSEWSLPGGAQHVGETVRAACAREVKEETNLDIAIEELIGVVDGIFQDQDGKVEHHYTLIDFKARWLAGNAAPGDDVSKVVWVTLADLKHYNLWEETERIIKESATSR